MRLAAPTKKARAELRAYGIELDKYQKKSNQFKGKDRGKILSERLSEELGLDTSGLTSQFNRILADKKITENATALGDELMKAARQGMDLSNNPQAIGEVRDAIAGFVRSAYSEMNAMGILREMVAKNADKSLAFINEVFGKNHDPKMVGLIGVIRKLQLGWHQGGHCEPRTELPGATLSTRPRSSGLRACTH